MYCWGKCGRQGKFLAQHLKPVGMSPPQCPTNSSTSVPHVRGVCRLCGLLVALPPFSFLVLVRCDLTTVPIVLPNFIVLTDSRRLVALGLMFMKKHTCMGV